MDGSAERFWVTATVLKTVETEKRCEGSNPSPSAKLQMSQQMSENVHVRIARCTINTAERSPCRRGPFRYSAIQEIELQRDAEKARIFIKEVESNRQTLNEMLSC